MSSSDIIDVITAFCDLAKVDMDPTTLHPNLLPDFIKSASIVLDYGFPDTSNIGDHPAPPETPARNVRTMINNLARNKYICLRCGYVIPPYSCCSPDEKKRYGYLDGWCPTCDSKYSRNSTIDYESVLKAFEFFELEYIDYYEVEENIRQALLVLQDYYQETGLSFHMSVAMKRKSRIHCARVLSGPPRTI